MGATNAYNTAAGLAPNDPAVVKAGSDLQKAKGTATSPINLKADPNTVNLPQGGKAKVNIVADRKTGYQGAITVTLSNLPANVTASSATIASGQNSVTIELSAGANATVGNNTTVQAQGTATMAPQTQVVSASFTVNIQKK